MRLKIQIPSSWSAQDNPDGPATYCRHESAVPGPLQISWAEYSGGPIPNPSAQDLQQMAFEMGHKNGFGAMMESSSGACRFGKMGSAVFRSAQHPRIQIWFLSNGRDFINVTHICPEDPEAAEVSEAQIIVRSLMLGQATPNTKPL